MTQPTTPETAKSAQAVPASSGKPTPANSEVATASQQTQVAPTRTPEESVKARLRAGQNVQVPMPRRVKVCQPGSDNAKADPKLAGHFLVSEQTRDEKGNAKTVYAPYGDEFEAVILMVRKMMTGPYSPDQPSLYTHEMDMDTSTIQLRLNGQIVDSGDYQTMKAKHDLTYWAALYLWLPDTNEVVRFPIKGAALSGNDEKGIRGWIEYAQSFQWNEAIFDYFTRFSTVLDATGATSFYRVHFERGKLSDWDAMEAQQRKARANISMYEMVRDAQSSQQSDCDDPRPPDGQPAVAPTVQPERPEAAAHTSDVDGPDINPDDIRL
jgi:hypothetical protein